VACIDPYAEKFFDRSNLPAFADPFSGSGALALSAQWLGLESHASDLNPVSVLINKALIEIPPKFADQSPINPAWRDQSDGQRALTVWRGAQGLAGDVRYYGQWMRDRAISQIGKIFPKVLVTSEMASQRPDLKALIGQELTVRAWIWSRTIKSRPESILTITKPSEHHPDRHQPGERQRVMRQVLEILCQPPASIEPREGPFDNPSTRQDLEALRLIRALDDLNRKLWHRRRDGVMEPGTLIATIREHPAQKREFPQQRGQNENSAITILNIRRMDHRMQQQAYRVDQG
jgi:hypothetical protein